MNAPDPAVARKTWRTLEPVHAMVYFAPEPQEEYATAGLDVPANRGAGYFPARAAAMGAVGPAVVQATFFNFSERSVQSGMAGAWERASPAQVLAARYRGADRALRRLCGSLLDGPQVAESAALARTAVEGCTPEGRPLHAAHAELPWPDGPAHVQLWHAVTILREYRGDGHVAALVGQGVSGLEAAVLHVAQGDSWTRWPLQKSRGYRDEQWDAAVAGLTQRGWLQPDGSFTPAGRASRQQVEDLTDALALPPWAALGEDGCTRLRELVRPLSTMIVAAGGIGIK